MAEPQNVRREFEEAAESNHMALRYSELQTMITVVDSPSFNELYSSRDAVFNRPDLISEDGSVFLARLFLFFLARSVSLTK